MLRTRAACPANEIRILGATGNNLRNVDVDIPLGLLHLRHRRIGLGQVHADQRHAPASCDVAH